MKNKLEFLTKVSLKRKICNKWFIIANILLAIGILCALNIDSIITLFGGDFNKKTEIYVVDNVNAFETFEKELKALDKQVTDKESYKFILYEEDVNELKKELETDDNKILVEISSDENTVITAKITSNNFLNSIDYQLFTTAINNTKTSIALLNSNIDEEELNKLYSTVPIERIVLDETKNSEDENTEMIITTVFPLAILPFFMLTLFLVQMIGAEINDEKTTRGMEIIISNVSPKTHFFSKMLAGNIFVIFQGILLIIYASFGILIRYFVTNGNLLNGLGFAQNIINSYTKIGFVDKLIYVVPLTIILMLITFIAYSLLAGILASMTTNAEDFGQLQTPIMVISLIGYYLAMMAGTFKGALFIKILSYVPLISAILSPSLLVLEQIGVIDVIISIIITSIFVWLLIKYGLRIYKVGILNYSSKDLYKKMFKAMKTKN